MKRASFAKSLTRAASAKLFLGLMAAAVPLMLPVSNVSAAVVTNWFLETFDGPTLHPALTNHNNAPFGGGVAALDGVNGVTAQGFYFNASSLLVFTGNSPSLTTSSWVMEVALASTGDIQTQNVNGNDVLFAIGGESGLRVLSSDTSSLAMFMGGNTFHVISGGVTALQPGDHLALVYTRNQPDSSDTYAYYRNGQLVHQGNILNVQWQANSNFAAFGIEVHSSAFGQRGFHASLDAIAFSTFTGAFDPQTNFAIPEPSSLAMLGVGLLGLIGFARGGRCAKP